MVYLDLFSGPGRYDDGNKSTPLLVVEKAINHFSQKVPKKIQFIFNDINAENVETLKSEISSFPNIRTLNFEPQIYNFKVNEETVSDFETMNIAPTLSFIDPFGYKGFSLSLVKALVKDWGCDSIFFFNYRRINPGIENEVLEKPISLVFSEEILMELRKEIQSKTPAEREKIILHKIKEVFKEWGMKFVLSFPFKNISGNRTTHYLIFVTKHFLGFDIMKQIMGKASSNHTQEIPSFEYNPASVGRISLFDNPLDDLKKMLLNDFNELNLTMKSIYETHSCDNLFLRKNYVAVLTDLLNKGIIKTDRKPRKGSFADSIRVSFPKKQK